MFWNTSAPKLKNSWRKTNWGECFSIIEIRLHEEHHTHEKAL